MRELFRTEAIRLCQPERLMESSRGQGIPIYRETPPPVVEYPPSDHDPEGVEENVRRR